MSPVLRWLLFVVGIAPLGFALVMGILAPTVEETLTWLIVECIALVPAVGALHLLVEGGPRAK